MAEISPPTMCLTTEALQSVRQQGVDAITFDPVEFDAVRRIAGTPPEAVADITLAFGGVQRWRLGHTRFDNQQNYYIVPAAEERSYNFGEPDLPLFDPDANPNTRLIVVPIPKTWTSEEMAALLLRGIYAEPSIPKTALTINAIGAAAGTTAGLLSQGQLGRWGLNLSQEEAALLGMSCGLALSAAATVAAGPILAARYARRQAHARQHRPFLVRDGQGNII